MYFTSGVQLNAALSALPTSKVGFFVAFDAAYYSANYMANYTGTLSALEHYVQIGSTVGTGMAKPNATFDPAYYANAYADLQGAGFNSADLLYHFLKFGLDEGRVPNAMLAAFDGDAYLEANPDVAAYVAGNLAQFGGSTTNGAIAHYVKFGSFEGREAPINDIGAVSDVSLAVNTVAENAPVGAVVGITGQAADPDAGSHVTYSLTDSAGGKFAINAITGVVTVAAALDFEAAASHNIIVTATSSDGSTSSQAFTIAVTDVNDVSPVAQAAAANVAEGATLISGQVTATDADSTSLTYSLNAAAPAGLTFNANGSYSFDAANPAYNSLKAGGAPAVLTVAYTATDGVNSGVANLVITVTGTNDTPVAQAVVASGAEDATLIEVTPVSSDVDSGDTATYSVNSQPTNGTVSFNATSGKFEYVPTANYNGTDSFTYKVTDGSGATSVATATVTVSSVNDAPVASNAAGSGVEDHVINGSVSASDAENDALTYSVVAGPSHGIVVLNADGTYVYTPAADYNGTDTFTYKVNDGTADSNTATVTLTLAPVDEFLTAAQDTINGTSGDDLILASNNTLNAGDTINGNGGADRLVHFIDNSAAHTNFSGFGLNGVEILEVTADKTNFADNSADRTDMDPEMMGPSDADYTNSTSNDAIYDLSSSNGITTLRSVNSTQDVNFQYVNAGANLEVLNLTDGVNVNLDFRNDAVTGSSDSVNVVVTDSDDDNVDAHIISIDNDIETINLSTGGTGEVRIGRLISFGDGEDSSVHNTLNISNDNVYGPGSNDLFIGDDDGQAWDGALGWKAIAGSDSITGGSGDGIENSLDGAVDHVNAADYNGNITLSTEASVDGTTITLGNGDDVLFAGQGGDSINGGAGSDYLWGNLGADTIDGGADSDIYLVKAAGEHAGDRFLDTGTSGTDEIRFIANGEDDATLNLQNGSGIEKVTIGDYTGNTSGTQALNVNASGYYDNFGGSEYDALVIEGNDGNNSIVGTNISLIYHGQSGFNADDTIIPNTGTDTIDALAGNDLVLGENNISSADVLNGGDTYQDTYGGGNTYRYYDDPVDSNGDTLSLSGSSYASGLTLNSNFNNFERLVVGDTNSDGESNSADTGTEYNYNVTFGSDANAESQNHYWNGSSYVDLDNEVDFIVDARALDGGVAALTFDATIEDDAEFQVYGGAGNDVVRTGTTAGGDTVWAGNGHDQVWTYTGNDVVLGGEGNDTINGGTGSESLLGEAGNDLFNTDDDALDSTDTIDGGADTNTLTFLADAQHENDVDFTNVTNVQIVRLANGAGSTLHLGAEAEAGGVDFVYGASGDDVIDASSQAANLTGTQESSGGQLASNAGYTTSIWIDGGSGNDKLAGGTGNDDLHGGTGADSIWGNDGDDAIYGDGVTNATEADYVNGGAGNDTIYSYGTNGTGQNQLTKNTGSDDVVPHESFASPDAHVDGHADHTTRYMVDTIDGGAGTADNLVLSGDHTVYFTHDGTDAAMTNVEKITLVDNEQYYYNGISDNYDLTFVNGNVAAGQTLTVDGSALNGEWTHNSGYVNIDTLRVDAAEDTDSGFVITGGTGADTLIGGNLADYVNDSVNGYLADTISGGAGNDVIVGNAGKDQLAGGDGDDRFDTTILELRQGYDNIYGQAADSTVADNGTDTINLLDSGVVGDLDFAAQPGYRTIRGIENLQLADGADAATLGLYAQTAGIVSVDGGSGNDWIDARAYTHSITISGADGNDTIYGGSSQTFADIAANGVATNSLDGGDGDDVLYTDIIQDSQTDHQGVLTGGAGNDVLHGARNDDVLTGGAGSDTLYGYAGNDVLTGDSPGYADYMDGGTGNDTINANGGNDTVIGGEGNDTINLTNGGDVNVTAGSGDDTVYASGTNVADSIDTLTGGTGTDTLVLSGNHTVVFDGDFTGFESIKVSNGASYSLTLDDLNAAAGITFTVDGSALVDDIGADGPETLFVNGGAEFDARFNVTGGDWNDVIWGGALSDTISGGNGDDLIGGGAGSDQLMGGAGNDTLFGGADSDTLTGGAGADTFVFVSASDSQALRLDTVDFRQGEGDKIGLGFAHTMVGTVSDFALVQNTFQEFAGSGSATVVYDAEDRRIFIDRNDDGILNNADIVIQLDSSAPATMSSADFITYTGGLVISGGTGNDLLTGGLGNDTIYGGPGNDTLLGNAGDDLITGWTGNDSILGGDGNDTIVLAGGTDTVDAGSGDDIIDTGSNIDPVAGALNVLGNLEGGAGNDSLIVHHDDTISGANITGIENLVVAESHVWMTAAQHEGFADIIDGDESTVDEITLTTAGLVNADADIEVYDLSSDGDNTIYGADVAQTINGGSSADLIFGASGDDVLNGDAGNDTLTGGSGNDVLTGGSGDDVLNVDSGWDTVVGYEHGADTLNVSSLAVAVLTLGTANGDTIDLSATNNDGGIWVEAMGGNDSILGSAGSDYLIGGDGNDTIDSGSNATGSLYDVIDAGSGDDLIQGFLGSSDVVLGGDGTDTLALTGTSIDLNNASDDQLVSVEIITAAGAAAGVELDLYNQTSDDMSIIGSAFDDTITGAADANNTIDGGAGNDHIHGQSDADVLIGGAGNDDVYAGWGDDTLTGGTGNDYLMGGEDDDVFIGFENADVIDGGSGNDTLVLSGTSASLNVADNWDVRSIETIDASGALSLSGVQIDLINQSDDFTVLGSDYSDFIRGGSGDELIMAGGGNDTIQDSDGYDTVNGGDGIDTVTLVNNSDLGSYGFTPSDDQLVDVEVIDARGAISGDVTIDLSEQTEAFTVYGVDDGSFLAGDDIYGGAGNDTIYALDGNDVVYGNSGDDVIVGGYGSDDLYGGDGNDTIDISHGSGWSNADYVEAGSGNDTINASDSSLDFYDTVNGGDGDDTLNVFMPNSNNWADNVTNVETINWTTSDHDSSYLITQDSLVASGDTITFNLFDGTHDGNHDFNFDGSNETDGHFVVNGCDDNDKDIIRGGQLSDNLSGVGGEDDLYGNAGDDTLTGGSGDDYLYGGDGNDTIELGVAAGSGDALVGDGDTDEVELNYVNTGYDTIHNFEVANDWFYIPTYGDGGDFQTINGASGEIDLGAGMTSGDVVEIEAHTGTVADLTATGNDGDIESLIAHAIANTGGMTGSGDFTVVLYNDATDPADQQAGIYAVSLSAADGDLGTGDFTVQLLGVVDVATDSLDYNNFSMVM